MHMAIRIAINGFGRIGRSFLRSVLLDTQASKLLDIVAINQGPKPAGQLDILFKYDSVMGQFPDSVTADDKMLTIGSKKIALYAQADPAQLPWQSLGVDWVVEASGFFTEQEKAALHLSAGAKKVLITAPGKNVACMVIPGVNDHVYDAGVHHVVSLGSCTTNCFAAVLKVLCDNLTIERGMMTTIHSYTNTQALLDVADNDPRKSRAAALNIIPTKTGAGGTISSIFPQLEGKLETMALRVPLANVSLVDFTFVTKQVMTVERINNLFSIAAIKLPPGLLAYTELPLVSSDYLGNTHAAIVDGTLTKSQGTVNKVCAWYDNEFGYSSRLKEFLLHKA